MIKVLDPGLESPEFTLRILNLTSHGELNVPSLLNWGLFLGLMIFQAVGILASTI